MKNFWDGGLEVWGVGSRKGPQGKIPELYCHIETATGPAAYRIPYPVYGSPAEILPRNETETGERLFIEIEPTLARFVLGKLRAMPGHAAPHIDTGLHWHALCCASVVPCLGMGEAGPSMGEPATPRASRAWASAGHGASVATSHPYDSAPYRTHTDTLAHHGMRLAIPCRYAMTMPPCLGTRLAWRCPVKPMLIRIVA